MKEKITTQQDQLPVIIETIITHRKKEIEAATQNIAIAAVKVGLNGKEKKYWLTNTDQTNKHIHDIVGNALPETRETGLTPVDVNTFYKHSKFGMFLNSLQNEQHEFVSANGKINFIYKNRATYSPTPTDYAEDIKIEFAGTTNVFTSNKISELFNTLAAIKEDEIKLKKAQEEHNEQEEKKLNARLIEKKKNRDEELLEVKRFRRRTATLRYQPTLDPIQDEVKSAKIFNGNLIINGGPGTGKTTSLIQRIKFLTSSTIEEFAVLKKNQKDILFDHTKNWQFFTPNRLLALFLRNSMVQEKLIANDQTVKVWEDYKLVLFKEYRLTDYETKRPFILFRKNTQALLPNSSGGLKKLHLSFEKFFLEQQLIKFKKIQSINSSAFSWNTTAEMMKRTLKDFKCANLQELLRLYFNLNEQFGKPSQTISAEFNELLHQEATKLLIALKKDQQGYLDVENLLASLIESNEEEDDDLEESDRKDEDYTVDYEEKIHNLIKSLVRRSALIKFDSSAKFTLKDKSFLALLPEIPESENFLKIGQIAFFKKYFEKLSQGIVSNVYREIPAIYKKFRKSELLAPSLEWPEELLKTLVEVDNNTRLHTDEVSFLLVFINNLNTDFARSFPGQYKAASHPYIDAFKNVNKAVIGIDEATDFSLIDLMAMSRLNHPDFSSVTLSGDMMQKITQAGLEKWEDYIELNKGTEKYNLVTSYRQSNSLLELAKSLYYKINNENAPYKSFLPISAAEPSPLLLISEDEDAKMEWLVKRIIEIHTICKEIPSIAIFLPDESQLEKFADTLGSFDSFSDVGIKVKACRNGEVLGDPDTVRVFSVDKIKGLEFEAAFFHNADAILNAGTSAEMFYKYLYVGLSRASFYLGMTLTDKLPYEIEFLADNFSTVKDWNI